MMSNMIIQFQITFTYAIFDISTWLQGVNYTRSYAGIFLVYCSKTLVVQIILDKSMLVKANRFCFVIKT